MFIITKYTSEGLTFYEFDNLKEAVEFHQNINGTRIFTTLVNSTMLPLSNQTQTVEIEEPVSR